MSFFFWSFICIFQDVSLDKAEKQKKPKYWGKKNPSIVWGIDDNFKFKKKQATNQTTKPA